ncbi:glycosyltransferase [Sphingobacterium paludis]|uniref:Glycosyltransferase involved in cell wall biosynthesis n=1 Tax=Sphingobacterium paludis TaxID=1476465 RepID=A0A4R7D1Q9_9SPHI|nr:glycosyltransferase [Sphingobacterium paludis]TDS14670.1 glycosyltransferase involved in cell wall biosynthesis [Sphingobacterium paludis]
MQTVLFIGLVWPEPKSSAAGTRIIQLVNLFLAQRAKVLFASAAGKTPYSYPLSSIGVQEVDIQLNDSRFDDFISTLQPDVVIYDRFMIEEQYGWRVRQFSPQSLSMLDTEDLHFLRQARQDATKKSEPLNLHNAIAKREIASILRCDLSLIISRQEMAILQQHFSVPNTLLYYLPFLEDEILEADVRAWKPYSARTNFLFIGNFLHEPNWHTVQRLKYEVWPLLRQRLPHAELHIFGAYASEKVYQLHQPKERFLIKDRAADARETMSNYRVLLAPIAYGAGAKGKFIDAMQTGTPSITTSVGAESMRMDDTWNGFVEDDLSSFVNQAIYLYEDEATWQAAQRSGVDLLNNTYGKMHITPAFLNHINQLLCALPAHRQQHFIGEILHSQQVNSLKYMALWIEAKNKL